MKKRTLGFCFFLAGSLSSAQINDAQAIVLARPYVARYAQEAVNSSPQVNREVMMEAAGGPVALIYISFGEVNVTLHSSGEFQSFSNLSASVRRHEAGAPDLFATDDAAWEALESMLTQVDLPSGLTRKKLVRATGNGNDFAFRYTMNPRPHGYEADAGNQVWAEIHRTTGRLLSLSVVRGWTYEEPNVRVTPEDAVSAVRLAHGGAIQDWQSKLSYMSVARPDAPEYARNMRANKTMRLHHTVWSVRGTARVDSVTGDIVDFASSADAGHPPKIGASIGGVSDEVILAGDGQTANKATRSEDEDNGGAVRFTPVAKKVLLVIGVALLVAVVAWQVLRSKQMKA